MRIYVYICNAFLISIRNQEYRLHAKKIKNERSCWHSALCKKTLWATFEKICLQYSKISSNFFVTQLISLKINICKYNSYIYIGVKVQSDTKIKPSLVKEVTINKHEIPRCWSRQSSTRINCQRIYDKKTLFNMGTNKCVT